MKNITGSSTDTRWDGAYIAITIDGNTRIVCTAEPGTAITDPRWKISKDIQLFDSVYGGLPYVWTQWPLDNQRSNGTGLATNDFVFKASDALLLTFV